MLAYLDDLLLVSESEEKCEMAVSDSIDLLESLGFVINVKKSVFKPSHRIEYLGVILDSGTMKVTLTEAKMNEIVDLCSLMRNRNRASIRSVCSLVGKL